ncbi:MAG TPA: hypothetical protein VHD56_19660 [Tepidisphaeraceae bacterium]|nr:hypothetical protein [Tepidisphaeraceae bacterium]
MYEFRWNEWNIEHASSHGVDVDEMEFVVNRARRPWPRFEGDGKFKVRGQTEQGRYIQVIYIFSPDEVVYVIHARPLTEREKRQFRRRER